jgi:hypothetical protein
MIQLPEMKTTLRLLQVTCLSVLMLCGLAIFSVPIVTQTSPPVTSQSLPLEALATFTPTGHFVAVFTPTSEWNNEIPLVASSVLDNQGVIFASFREIGVSHDKILRSTDGGKHWDTIQLPLSTSHPELALSPNFAQDHIVFGAFNNGLFRSTDSGSQWTYVSVPPVTHIDLLRVSPNYPADHTLFIGSYGDYGGGVHRSTDDGLTWSFITTDTAPYVTDLEVSPGYPADPTLFISIYNDGIFRSDNGGITWTHLTAPQFSPDFRITLSPDFDTDHTLFVGANGISDGGAFRSTNRGDNWTSIRGGGYTYLVVVSPNFAQDQTVVVEGDNDPSPMISEDAGNTWYPMPGFQSYGIYGRKNNVTLSYEHGVLLPVASTNQTIYRYHWPSLGLSPILALLEPGNTDPLTISVPLNPDEPAQTNWVASENAAWLSVSPLSGTLPGTLTLVADVAQVTETTWTPVRLDTQWSLRQTETITVPVGIMRVHSRVYLPLMATPRLGIHGRVTDNGVPVAGIPLELRFYNGSAWSSIASTYTQADGWFAFTNAPSLGAGQRYYVRYQNTTGAGRLWTWHTRVLDTFVAGSSSHIGDFDVADIGLVSPGNNTSVSLPRTFQWSIRSAMPSDTYEFNLYDPSTGTPYFYTDPPLGYVGSYTLNTLPGGFAINHPYAWEIWVYSPDGGYGISYETRMISFTNQGLTDRPSAANIAQRLFAKTRVQQSLDFEMRLATGKRQR